MSTLDRQQELHLASPTPSGEGLRIAIAVAEWNAQVTEALLQGALELLRTQETGEVAVMRVPGTFELINASARLQDWGYDAVIAIGCVVRGDTPHFDYICQGVTAGIAQLNTRQVASKSQSSTRGYAPVIFGVLTTETMQQALDRAGGALGNKGAEAAETALKMCRPVLNFEFAPEA